MRGRKKPLLSPDVADLDPSTLLPRRMTDGGKKYQRAKVERRRDPLAIDLGGDGIQMVSGDVPVLFDHDGNGVKTGTGWISGGDAWLVMDRNGNGTIDSGQELFGVDTVITTKGTYLDNAGVEQSWSLTRNASSGFEALTALDGNGDKVFDARDEAFQSIRLWQDQNSDGISQADELFTLQQKGILEISLNADSSSVELGNGNGITGQAPIKWAYGGAGQIDSIGLQSNAANLNLADTPFFREFVTKIPLTEQAKALPDLMGTGWVRDLGEAMSLNSAAAEKLAGLVTQYSHAHTKAEQVAMLDALLHDWADTTGKLNQNTVPTRNLSMRVISSTLQPGQDPTRTPYTEVVEYKFADPGEGHDYASILLPDRYYEDARKGMLNADGIELLKRLNILEVFNGQRLLETTVTEKHGPAGASSGGSGSGGAAQDPSAPRQLLTITLLQDQIDEFESAYQSFRDGIYDGLVFDTRLQSFIKLIELNFDGSAYVFDTSKLVQRFEDIRATDPKNALVDFVELATYAQIDLDIADLDIAGVLTRWIEDSRGDAAFEDLLHELHVFKGAETTGTGDEDLFLAGTAGSTFAGGEGADQLFGGSGVDKLYGDAGADRLEGNDGDDTLDGGAGSDVLKGGRGNDNLNGGTDNDTLDGGAGNDSLSGGNGDDVILFGKGDGQDYLSGDYDSRSNRLDVLQFKAGVSASEIVATRDSSSLVLSIAGTTDKITIGSFFNNDDPRSAYNPVQQVRFADGTSWSIDDILSRYFGGTAGNDQIGGTVAADVINGQAGNDTISGYAGNDVINGGDGIDNLSGNAGNDTLDGGSGNDYLTGGDGDDVILFGKGDGQDYLSGDSDSRSNRLDVLQFKAGVSASEIVATRDSSSLVLSIAGTTDKITIGSFFNSDDPRSAYNPVQQFRFADGTNWSVDDILSRYFGGTAGNDQIGGTVAADVINGQAGNDTISGYAGNDVINGGDGNDNLSGNAGNDVLDGGAGSDSLTGGDGDDVILFGKGDGQDYLSGDSDTRANRLDTLQFKAGVSPDEIIATRDSSNLVLSIAGTTDKITIGSFFNNDDPRSAYNPVQQVRFANGTVWNITQILAVLSGGTSGADNITGTSGADVIDGRAGNDTLRGAGGNDQLFGGDGTDNLSGDAGNDTLDGGSGNDYLTGGDGDDVILFGKGDGQDYLSGDSDSRSNRLDVLQFKAGVSASEIVATRDSSSLVLSIAGTTDKITIGSFFNNDDPRSAYNPVQQVRFADGTSWSIDDILSRYFGGTAGNDQIGGTVAADVINGQAGNDTISGYAGNDVINGGDGIDNLSGNAGNDTLDGGSGNDYLTGGDGDDVILFGKGDGQDYLSGDSDSRSNRLDVLQFKAGVSASEIVATRDSSSLVLSIAGTTDKITIGSFFNNDDPRSAYNPVQQVRFADGTSWSIDDILSRYFGGTAGNDQIGGTVAADVINGQAGNDTISGYAGNDVINGGDGIDNLSGNAGNDTLDGGSGNDYLTGGDGDDVILFGKGDGQDYLSGDSDSRSNRLDVLQFKAGVSASEIVATRDSSSLVLSIAGTTDKITIGSFFNNDDPRSAYNPVQQVRFADGTNWSVDDILSRYFGGTAGNDQIGGTVAADVINGQAGNDTISGYAGNDVINGGDGIDNLSGNAGNDTLDGGAGNDYLTGGDGDDVILFGKGDGQDYLSGDYDSRSNRLDVLQFKAGVSASEIVATRDSSSLVLSIVGTTDKITIGSFFNNDDPRSAYNPVQQVRFADGTSWSIDDILSRYFAGTAAADTISGTVSADLIRGQAGNDSLSGNGGNDTLYGGDGNDTLSGGDGNDVLEGGVGNDTLYGGNSNDTYVFGRGDGQDSIQSKYDSSTSKLNVLQLKDGISSGDVTTTRSGENLVIGIAGTTDTVTVSAFFYNSGSPSNNYNPLQQIRFADGTAWSLADIDNKVKGLPMSSASARTANTDRQADALISAMASFSGASATATHAAMPSYSTSNSDALMAVSTR